MSSFIIFCFTTNVDVTVLHEAHSKSGTVLTPCGGFNNRFQATLDIEDPRCEHARDP